MPWNRRQWLQQSAAWALTSGLLPPVARSAEPPQTAAGRPTGYGEAGQYADAVFVDGPPQLPAKESFTIAVLPDTQHYSQKHPDTFHAQTTWIAEKAKERNIKAVFQLGDITNHSTPEEWQVADKAMTRLNEHVPYFMVIGNHDYADGKCVDRTTRFNEYFPVSRFQDRRTFGGTYDKEPNRMENSFHVLDTEGRKFLVLALEYGPRNDVIRWANQIAERYADREAILLTHAYMYFDETRYDWARHGKIQQWNPHSSKMAEVTGGDVNDGEQLWQKLVSQHENFILTLNGHVLNDGLARMATPTAGGRDVHQVLVNFQMKPNGGDGWLRLLEFNADGHTLDVVDYSPVLDRQNHSTQNKFCLRTAPVKA
jgi:predicted phosphodiesterase